MEKQLEELNKACSIAEKAGVEMLKKSHISGYTRQDGSQVAEHEDSREKKTVDHKAKFEHHSNEADKAMATMERTSGEEFHQAAKKFDHHHELAMKHKLKSMDNPRPGLYVERD